MSTQTRIWLDGKDLHARTYQDVEAIIENNKRLQNTPQRTEHFRHIASIPNNILNKWIVEEGIPFLRLSGNELKKLIRKKLNDPDWKWLRTTDGRI